jgi:hypothetical protein
MKRTDEPLNIVTMCMLDGWIKEHLRRFVHMARLNVPKARLHLLIPSDHINLTKDEQALCALLSQHFKDLQVIQKQDIPGRLLYFDLARAYALDVFGLKEALYVDVDSDILTDISDIPQLIGDAELAWTPNSVRPDDVISALRQCKLPADGPYMEPAVIYMRRSFVDDFHKVLANKKLQLGAWVPGSAVWNIIMQQCPKRFMLPYEYNTVPWEITALANAKIIHYAGNRFKEVRNKFDMLHWPESIKINLKKDIDEWPGIGF